MNVEYIVKVVEQQRNGNKFSNVGHT